MSEGDARRRCRCRPDDWWWDRGEGGRQRSARQHTTYPLPELKEVVSNVSLYKPPPVLSGWVGSTRVPTTVGLPSWSTTENLHPTGSLQVGTTQQAVYPESALFGLWNAASETRKMQKICISNDTPYVMNSKDLHDGVAKPNNFC